MTTSTSSTTAATSKPLFVAQAAGSVMASSSRDGCFICGDTSHGFRNCPKRFSQQPSFGKGGKKGTFWIEPMLPSSLSFIGMVEDGDTLIYDTSGYGVLDIGATETVCSLEALEALMEKRRQLSGELEKVEVFSGPSSKRPFRFGNGGVQFSSSYM